MRKLWLVLILIVVGCGHSDPRNDRLPADSWAITDGDGLATDRVPAIIGPDRMHPDEYLTIPVHETVRVIEDVCSMESADCRDVRVAWDSLGPNQIGFIERRWLRPTK